MRDAYYPLLADPSPESWQAICALLRHETAPAHAVAELEKELSAWPAEVARPILPPLGTPPFAACEAVRCLCRSVKEVDLYPLYVRAAREAPALRLRDGTPAVRLQRNFTGALQGAHGKTHRIGVVGQGDLYGSLCVEWSEPCMGCLACTSISQTTLPGVCDTNGTAWYRLSVALEIEVKTQAGKARPEQVERMEALRRRGELAFLVRRCDEMISLLVQERDRILTLVRG